MPSIDKLCKNLNYTFKNAELLTSALRHRSVARGNNNERLEFLGDAIVNMVIAAALYHKFQRAREGQLSRLRATLVREETLAEIARQFHLGEYLTLGQGELKSGGFQRQSILADAMEAVIAAIYLDSDLTTCQQCILAWYQDRLDKTTLTNNIKDAKTNLQEYLQSHKQQLPIYTVIEITGEDHNQLFRIRCEVPGCELQVEGVGTSRRRGEQAAAAEFLQVICKP